MIPLSEQWAVSIYSIAMLDKGMLSVPGWMELLAEDFIILLRMKHIFKHITCLCMELEDIIDRSLKQKIK